ncbi:hypothetical protein MPER_02212, partial [Moniliophthora perniciosa FA553]
RVFNLWRQKRAFLYPPGPPGNAITGNFFDLPQKKPWLVYTEWAKQYGRGDTRYWTVELTYSLVGDIIHLEALGDHVIILSSLETVNDLLEKRSRIYSSTPHPEVAELSGWGFNITLQGYHDTWRKNRKTYPPHLRPDAVAELRPIMQGCIAIFLDNLLHTPDNFVGHIDWGVDSAQDPLLRNTKKLCRDLRELPFNHVLKDM